jgi:hypothetical protein
MTSVGTYDADALDLQTAQWLDSHLADIRKLIVDEARRRSREGGDGRLRPLDVSEAAKLFAPGKQWPPDLTFWKRIGASISGVTLMSALLAIVFGIAGIYLAVQNESAAAPYFDITKIFAGAIVGSTAVGTLRR